MRTDLHDIDYDKPKQDGGYQLWEKVETENCHADREITKSQLTENQSF